MIDGREIATKKLITTNSNAQAQIAARMNVPPIHELDSQKESATFIAAMKKITALSPDGAQVYVHADEDYKNMRLFLTQDGTGGFALNGTEMVSLFSKPNSRQGRALLRTQMDEGGTHGDAFDTFLPSLYAQEGLRVVARLPWDDSQAPKGWDAERNKQYNGGKPDVVFLAADPGSAGRPYVPGEGQKVATYEEGVHAAETANDGFGIPSRDESIADNAKRFVLNWKASGHTPMSAYTPGDTSAESDLKQKLDAAWADTATPQEVRAWSAANPPSLWWGSGPSLGDWLLHRDEQKAKAEGRPVRNPLSMGLRDEPMVAKDITALRDSKAFSSKFVDEKGNFTPERAALHDQIINEFLKGLKPVDHPTQLMNGGGPAAGKSAMGRFVHFPVTRKVDDKTGQFLPDTQPPESLLVDPDQIKMQLPEVRAAMERLKAGIGQPGDGDWASNSHEESSVIAAHLHQAALDRGYNVVYDGTGNSSIKSVQSKIDKAHAAGYRVEGNYLYLEPQEGLRRAARRNAETHRNVPEWALTDTYKHLPSIFDGIKNSGSFDHLRLFDNNRDGQPARLIGEGDGRNFDIKDPGAYNRFMSSRARTDRGMETVLPPADLSPEEQNTVNAQVDRAADEMMARAALVEGEVTKSMQDIAKKFGGELQGLGNRLKFKPSLKDKIMKDALAGKGMAPGQGMSPDSAALRIADAVRYTMSSSPENHAAMATAVLADFQKRGYKLKVKNFWSKQPPDAYRGINAQLQAPNGTLVELQFNTPDSLVIKGQNHDDYKEWGKLNPDTPEAKAIWDRMVARSDTIPEPPGIRDIAPRDELTYPDPQPLNATDSAEALASEAARRAPAARAETATPAAPTAPAAQPAAVVGIAAPTAPAAPTPAGTFPTGKDLGYQEQRTVPIGGKVQANLASGPVVFTKTGPEEYTGADGTKVSMVELNGLGEPGTFGAGQDFRVTTVPDASKAEAGVLSQDNGGDLYQNPNLWTPEEVASGDARNAAQAASISAIGSEMAKQDPESKAVEGAFALAASSPTSEGRPPYDESVRAMTKTLSRMEEKEGNNPFTGRPYFPAVVQLSTTGKFYVSDWSKSQATEPNEIEVASAADFKAKADELTYRAASRQLTSAWNGITNGGSSLLLSDAVGTYLGRDQNALTIGDIGMENFWGNASEHRYGDPALDGPEAFTTAGEFSQATYKQTQDFLKAKGIKYVDVWRGYRAPSSTDVPLGEQDVKLRPLSSFSTDPAVAARFADTSSFGDGQNGYLVKMRVPAADVFSVAGHGPGVLGESEVMVLNHPGGQTGKVYRSSGDRDVSNINEENYSIGGADFNPGPYVAPAAVGETKLPAGEKFSDPIANMDPEQVAAELDKRYQIDAGLRPMDVYGPEYANSYDLNKFNTFGYTEDAFARGMQDLFKAADAKGWTLYADPIANNGTDRTAQWAPFGWITQADGSIARLPNTPVEDSAKPKPTWAEEFDKIPFA